MAHPPGPGARLVDGPSSTSSTAPVGAVGGPPPPPGAVLVPNTPSGAAGAPPPPSVAGHHPHQVQSHIHPALHETVGPERMNILLGEVKSEYDALQTDCMVLKGQRDKFESKRESVTACQFSLLETGG